MIVAGKHWQCLFDYIVLLSLMRREDGSGLLTRGAMDEIASDVAAIRASDGGCGVIISPACVIRHPVDMDVLKRTAAPAMRSA